MSNTTKSSDDEIVGLLPPIKSMTSFLVVTVLVALATAFSGGIAFHTYLDLTPEWVVGVLSLVTLLFSFINFRITRGSFLCVNILQYYALFLAAVCMPSFLHIDTSAQCFLSFISISIALLAYYLISRKNYQNLVQYQKEHFADIKAAREEITKILKPEKKAAKRKK